MGMGRPKSSIPVLTRTVLKRRIAKKFDINQSDVDMILSEALREWSTALSRGHRVELRGFGSLHPVVRQSKPVRDISRGTGYMMPAGVAIKFAPAQPLERELKKLAASLRAKGLL